MEPELLSLSESDITALIADPALISSHEIALEVLDCLDDEIASIQAQIDQANIESNAKPLSPDRAAWLRRASYAAAMRRNERHRVMQRDKEIRGTKQMSQKKSPEAITANLEKQRRLAIEAETRRETKRLETEKQRTQQMILANAKAELKLKSDWNYRFVQIAKRALAPEIYDNLRVQTETSN